MFQILENQDTVMTDFSLGTQPESGAGPDLNKPRWTWTYFVNSH